MTKADTTSDDIAPRGRATDPCWACFDDYDRLMLFLRIFWVLPTTAQSMLSALEGKRTFFDLSRQWRSMKKGWRESGWTGERARDYLQLGQPLQLQMILSRTVDSYLAYVGDLIGLIHRKKPETLRSKEEVSLEDVLQHATMDDLVGFLS